MKKLWLSPFLSCLLATTQSQQYCLKKTIYKNSTKCDGTNKISVFLPVGNTPEDSCVSYDLPNDLGPGSTSMYCDARNRYHEDTFFGTKDCSADDADMSVKTTTHGDRCIGTIIGMSFIAECIPGPCPKEEGLLATSTVESTARRLTLEMHQAMALNHLAVVDP